MEGSLSDTSCCSRGISSTTTAGLMSRLEGLRMALRVKNMGALTKEEHAADVDSKIAQILKNTTACKFLVLQRLLSHPFEGGGERDEGSGDEDRDSEDDDSEDEDEDTEDEDEDSSEGGDFDNGKDPQTLLDDENDMSVED